MKKNSGVEGTENREEGEKRPVTIVKKRVRV